MSGKQSWSGGITYYAAPTCRYQPPPPVQIQLPPPVKPSRAQLIINIVVIVLLVIILGAILVPKAHSQEQNFDFSVSVYVYNGVLAGIPATCNAGDLAFITDATNGQNIYECNPANTFTQQLNSGGMGSGCTPPGTTLNAILTDLTGGACGAATKWTASGTTITGLATAIFNMSAAATLNVPGSAGFAPTTANNWGYDTTNNRAVLGNGTDTSFLTWIHGAAPTTNDCVKFSGTLGGLITNGGPCPATLASAAHQFFTSYTSTTGLFTKAQPACTDLSDSAGGCSMSTTAGGDLSGTLPSPTVAKVNGNTPGNTCTNQFTRSIDSSARGSCATVANADMANTATTVNGQTCTLGSSCTIPLSAVNPETATYQVLAADFSNYKTITVASGTFTITLVASGSQPAAGQYIQIINYGSGVVTVARSGQNINGAAGNFTLSAGSATAPTSALVISDATNYFASIDEGTVGTVTSAIVAGTANQVTASGTCTITTTGTCTLSLPAAVILGTDGSVAGTVQLANGGASAHTIYASGATTTNTIAGFTAVPTTLDLLTCTSSGTTCTLTDAGFLASNAVRKDTTNTAATGMTLDMSAATGATALKVPVIAGATAGADGVIDYDSTAKITHVRTNAADSLVAATTGTSTTTTQVLHATAVAGVYSASAVVDADIPAAITRTIANGTSAMGTGAISSGACATVVTTSATGTATTDNIMADFNADPTGVTGYVPASTGILTIIKYPTANNVNFKVCNLTASSITPGAITLNWRVVR